jgi:hypothetical protein
LSQSTGSQSCKRLYIGWAAIGPKLNAEPNSQYSAFDPGCVKTLLKSKFAANLPDFRKLQFAKALISLKLKFWRLDFNHNLIRSLTFSHSLDPKQTSATFRKDFDIPSIRANA